MTEQVSASVKSARRVLEVLDLLADHESPLTFTAIVDTLGYPKSSLHGLLREAVAARWVTYDPDQRSYALDIRALQAGNAYSRTFSLTDRALPHMRRIRDALDETIQLAVLDGRFNVYVAKVDGGHALTLESSVGKRLPAHATGLGKVLLADLPRADLRGRLSRVRLESLTDQTITDRTALDAELAAIRRVGYAVDREEYTRGVRCIAVPVRDATGAVVAGMSVSVPTIRFGRDFRQRGLEKLRAGATQLSAELGHELPQRTRMKASR